MPLNPPSYKGQDVYHSTNVYVNKVPVALWKPPQAGDSAIFSANIPQDPEQPAFTAEQQALIAQSQAEAANNPLSYGQLVVGGLGVGTTVNTIQGDLPAVGATGADFQGNPITVSQPVSIPPGSTPYEVLEINLNNALAEAGAGRWRRTGTNANILACFADMGHSELHSDAPSWCAAFAGTMLKRSGLPYVQGNLRAYGYNGYGQSIPVTQYEAWRRNDILIFACSHICFVRGVDPSTGNLQVIGGNQGSDVCQVNWGRGQLRGVLYVGRRWDIPDKYNHSIVQSLAGGLVPATR